MAKGVACRCNSYACWLCRLAAVCLVWPRALYAPAAHRPVGCAASQHCTHSPIVFSVPCMGRDAVCTCAHLCVGCDALQHCTSYGQGRYMHLQLVGLLAVLLLSTAHTLIVFPVPCMARDAACMCAHPCVDFAAVQHRTHSGYCLCALCGQGCCVCVLISLSAVLLCRHCTHCHNLPCALYGQGCCM